mgnify:CR=1 FL=1
MGLLPKVADREVLGVRGFQQLHTQFLLHTLDDGELRIHRKTLQNSSGGGGREAVREAQRREVFEVHGGGGDALQVVLGESVGFVSGSFLLCS